MTNIQKWFLIIALWLILLFSIFIFYWHQMRPMKIRQMCVQEAAQACAEIKSSVASKLQVNQAVYSDCLRKNGLDK